MDPDVHPQASIKPKPMMFVLQQMIIGVHQSSVLTHTHPGKVEGISVNELETGGIVEDRPQVV